MEKVKAVIVDDEERARRVIKSLISRSTDAIEVVDECSNIEEAVASIHQHQPAVVFLDVQMPKYEGYEIVNFFSKINFEIIFITAFDHYAIEAFDICAIDYLVKPIDRDRFDKALKKLIAKIASQEKLADYQELKETIRKSRQAKLIIPELGNRRILDMNKIIAIEADGAYTIIYIFDDQPITTSKNLKHYENELSRFSHFFRSHRSWIINANYVEHFNRTTNTLHLKDRIMAKISRNQYQSFDALLKS